MSEGHYVTGATIVDMIEDGVTTYLQSAVGEGTDGELFIRTWAGNILPDTTPNNMPMVTVNCLQQEQSGAGEIGLHHDMNEYNVVIVYFDVEPLEGNFNSGKLRRNILTKRMEGALITNFNLGALSYTDAVTGYRETVYDVQRPSILFDVSGQEGYYAFVSEIHLTVQTERSSA